MMLRKAWGVARVASRSSSTVVQSPFTPIDPLPRANLAEYVWNGLDKWADKTAVECGMTGRSLSYRQLKRSSERLGDGLVRLGLQPGDVITLILPNGPHFPTAFLGPVHRGLVVSTINPAYTTEEICNQLKDSDAKCIIAHRTNLGNAFEAKRLLNKDIPIISVSDSDMVSGDLPPSVIDFNSLVSSEKGPSAPYPTGSHPDSTAVLPYSSGTTGLPKGVCLTHACLTANLAQVSHPDCARIHPTTKNSQDVVPAVLPFFHVYGMMLVMLQSLMSGAKLVTLPKFEPNSFLKILENNKEIVLHLAPPMILFLGSHPGVTPQHLEPIRMALTGGAPCAPSDIERVHRKKRVLILQAYGMTEASPLLTYPGPSTEDTSTIGLPVANTLGKVVNLESGESMEAGEVGELCFKGPQVMKGYHNLPEATKETVDDDGWLHTGDIGYFDKRGYFYVEDRKKELIKVKGFQVAPAELEGILRHHPDIEDAGVVGVPSQKEGEKPVAFLVVKPGRSNLQTSQLAAYIADKVAPYKKISDFLFVDTIPKTPSGKILRKEMKKMATEMISK